MTRRICGFSVAGKIRRQDNGPQGSWRKKAGYRKAWRTRVKAMALVNYVPASKGMKADYPKTIRIRCRVFNLFDTSGLWSATKPIVDGLVDAAVIHSDRAFEQSGHLIMPSQVIDRGNEGVEILIDAGVDL